MEQGYVAARTAGLALLSTLRRTLGDLDQISAWLSVAGFVQAAPGFKATTGVMNGFSELILGVFGPEVGQHARSAIGVSSLPMNLPIIISAEVVISTK